MQKLALFLMFFVAPSVSNAESHSHDGRVHNHPFPPAGLHHRHGAGGLGLVVQSQENPPSSSQNKKKGKNGYYYYSLLGQQMKVKNYKKAVSLLTQSCNLNYGKACDKAGLFYGSGIGVKLSNTKATQFFDKSCKLNIKSGCNNLRLLKQKIAEFKIKQKNSEDIQLKRLRENPENFLQMVNPSERVILEAVKANPNLIRYINKPTEKVQLEALKKDCNVDIYITNPTPKAIQLCTN